MQNYEALEKVGSGSFAVIRKVRRRSDGKILACKELDYRRMSTAEKKQLVAEVNILRELNHPNIVRYYERFVDKESCLIYIITEYCEGGDLAAIIKRCKKEGKAISENIIWDIFTQLLHALDECHKNHGASGQILHRDLKPENVFLDSRQMIKLGDFGLSRMLNNPADFARTFVGTPYYMSPELVNESLYNSKSDIWSLGCLVYEMCALHPPFQAKTQTELNEKIKAGKFARLPSQYSDELNLMVRYMLQVDHQKRPSAKDFLKLGRVQTSVRYLELHQLEEDYKRRENELNQREAQLLEKENALALREKEFESYYASKINEVQQRQNSNTKENALSTANWTSQGNHKSSTSSGIGKSNIQEPVFKIPLPKVKPPFGSRNFTPQKYTTDSSFSTPSRTSRSGTPMTLSTPRNTTPMVLSTPDFNRNEMLYKETPTPQKYGKQIFSDDMVISPHPNVLPKNSPKVATPTSKMAISNNYRGEDSFRTVKNMSGTVYDTLRQDFMSALRQ